MKRKSIYYVGLDIHKKNISYCLLNEAKEVVREGTIPATREALLEWQKTLPKPWIGAMEATLFTGWIYDFLKPFALEIKVANPLRLKALYGAKKKNDRIDARKIADMLSVDLLPECYMAPARIRELRRVLRHRTLLTHLAVMLKNKTAGILMECGAEYNKSKLHGRRYFENLLLRLEVPESVLHMLSMNRDALTYLLKMQRDVIRQLKEAPDIRQRVENLMTIKGVGEVTALTWALEIGEAQRFSSIRQAVSYCGLCGALKESAGKSKRTPISSQRNKHLQWVLIEAAKLAVRWNPHLAEIYNRELTRGNRNRATLAVARKLAAYLLAVDKSGKPFEEKTSQEKQEYSI